MLPPALRTSESELDWSEDETESRPKITGIKADPTQKEDFDADFDFTASGGKLFKQENSET